MGKDEEVNGQGGRGVPRPHTGQEGRGGGVTSCRSITIFHLPRITAAL